MASNVKINMNAGAMAVLMGAIMLILCLVISLISDKGILQILFPPEEVRAVTSTMEGIDDAALLECAVYRTRVVYPYDFSDMIEDPAVDLGKNNFCVITARITAGYDLTVLPAPRVENNRLVVSLGEPVITSFTIDDNILMKEGFPDVKITPEQWGRLVEDITPFIKQMALDRDIMGNAESFGRDLLNGLFEGAGYGQIIFTE